ncbi:MAG: NHLP bacteriocin export ABC transporter permease/ATPase subunit [Simkaniaceae bacterium]|nr:MAG: NHLP bacteriocin export ABC transporter permease/ATPase subunit [Simkaniaceae bacterium]
MDSLFKEIGKKIEAPTNFHLSLEEKGKVYFLEKGSMILFASQKQGRRTLLSTVGSGRLLFTIEKDEEVPYEIFAFSEEKVTLWEVDRQQLASSLKSSSSHQRTFSSLLEHWLNQFSHFLFSPMEVSPKHWIKKGGELEVEKGEIFTLKISEVPSEKERVFWMTPKEGEYKLLGPHEYKFSKDHKYFPILPHLYFLSLGKGDYDVTSTAESVKEENWGEGLSQFHRFIGHYLIQKRHFLDDEELKRFEEKELLQEETLHETLSEMASLLERKEVDDGAIASQPLNQAIETVFKNIGLKLQSQKKWDGELKDQIAKAAEKSGARARVVLLGPLWWKFDSGPLLAFYGTQHHPVALIKNRWGHYEMIDPLKKTRKRVTAKIARLIAKDGYTFYQAIPDEIRKGGEALRFFLRVNKKEFWKLGVYGFIASLFSLFPPIAMAFIFNNAIPNANVTLLLQITSGLVASALSSSLFIFFRSLILGRIDGKLSSGLQPALWDRLLKLPANFFRRFTAGDLLQRVMAMEQMRPLLTSNIAQTILTGIFATLYVVAMAIYSLKLTMIGLILLIVAVGITYLCARFKIRVQQKVYEMQGKINGALVQILSGVSKLRVAGAENNAFSYWAKQFSKSKSLEMKAQNIQNIIATVMGAFPLLSFIIIFGAVIRMEEGGSLSIGDFLAFNSAFMTLSMAIFGLSNIVMQAAPIIPLWKRSHVIVEEPQEMLMKKTSPGKLTGDIRIDHVSFSYEEEGSSILDNVSIRVNPRQMIGIVGPSGSGKSTLIRMLLGFEKPHSGAVYYNGKDLSHLNINGVRKQMGVVLQGGGIVAGTLYQNIVAGGRYTEEQIDRATRLASFKRDLENFPMGLHTVVPMNGETLSGGQKQRLLIARALLPNPKILLFDEATSALDNRSQEEISQNIDQLDITRIVIAHRLSTIKNADRIYVLEGGKITQEGSFDELSKKPGLFAEMLKRQQL